MAKVGSDSTRATRIVRHASAIGAWEYVFCDAAPALGAYVRSYCGYHERSPAPMRRRELPAAKVVVIVDLGPTLRILDPTGAVIRERHHGGFVAGLDETFTLTETEGEQRGLQIDLTLVGARRLLGVPLRELTGCIVRFEDVFGRAGRALVERLADAEGWEARFEHLDRFFAERVRVDEAPPLEDWVAWALGRIESSGGAVTVDALAQAVGFSRKHLTTTFRDRFGLAPKPLARLVRFEGVMRELASGRHRDLTAVAIASGYFDQAHFIRDFRGFTGGTPGDYLVRRLDDGGGMRG